MPDDAPTADDLVALAEALGSALLARGLTLATAESCTGGLVGHILTEIPGSSTWYVGGAITYSDRLKEGSLAVPHETLAHHGAVSAQVAAAMASGAREAFGADMALAVTGIAGPGGGSPAKPIGLTYVGVSDASGSAIGRHAWTFDRSGNKRASVAAVLTLALDRLRDAEREGGST